MTTTPDVVYEERVSSRRTEAVCIALALVFLALSAIRRSRSGFGYVAALLLLAGYFFLFYTINCRTLIVRMTLLSEARGPVQDAVFSTRRPTEVLDAVAARVGARRGERRSRSCYA